MKKRFQGLCSKAAIAIQPGDTVTILKGTVIRSNRPTLKGEIAERTFKVKVKELLLGSNHPVKHLKYDPRKPVVNPSVRWATPHGYWLEVDVNDLPEIIFPSKGSRRERNERETELHRHVQSKPSRDDHPGRHGPAQHHARHADPVPRDEVSGQPQARDPQGLRRAVVQREPGDRARDHRDTRTDLGVYTEGDVVSLEDDHRRALAALRKIADFGHAEDCPGFAPVHECGCYEKSEQEIAKDCLEQIEGS